MFFAALVGLAVIFPAISAQSVSDATDSDGAVLSTLAPSSTRPIDSSISSSTTLNSISASASPIGGASFPTNLPRDYSPVGLQKLWDVVGPVQAPPFTTTVSATPVTLPSSPPRLYPAWYAPAPKDVLPRLKFPKGFRFGVATAAYQIEGAVKNEGKGPSMWDWATRVPGFVVDNSTGDIADLNYYLYKVDVERIKALGVNAHAFSISWSRVLPFGTADSPVNKAAISHYSDVIDYHLAQGVEPIITLFHWDIPLALIAYYGGFTSPKILDDFVNYAKTVFKAYNGRVKTWYTFNEPRVYCGQATWPPFNVTYAPGVNQTNAFYHCNYNVLRAHALAVQAFRELGIKGEIALKNDDFTGVPWRANSTDDQEAANRHATFQIGIYSDPLYTTGDWPKMMTDALPPSILPRFTSAERKLLFGSADFFAIDPYRNSFVAAPEGGIAACVSNSSHPNFPRCSRVMFATPDGQWSLGINPDPSQESWLQESIGNVRSLLKELHKRWPAKKMYVTEFGFAEPFENTRTELFRIVNDVTRTNYYLAYLGEILLSIHEDKIPIAGAFAWSMVDNAEWSSGLAARFGIQYVNYTSLERTYKRSAMALSEFFGSHL